jgi:hypothetical protein
MQVTVRCRLRPATRETAECFEVSARAQGHGNISDESWDGKVWQVAPQPPAPAAENPDAPILTPDRSQELVSGPWLEEARLTQIKSDRSGTVWAGRALTGASQRFPRLAQPPSRRPHRRTRPRAGFAARRHGCRHGPPRRAGGGGRLVRPARRP